MRRSLAVMCLVLASTTACTTTDTPTPAGTPSGGASERPPVGYLVTPPAGLR